MNSSTKDTSVKHNPGKLLTFYFLLSLTLLLAEDFAYTAKASTETPYVKEPVLLTVDINQTNHDIVLLIDFDLKKSAAYSFQRLDAKETDSHHDAKVRYTYLLYPLKSGDISVSFHLVKKVTNDESVAYSYSGDRDNVKGLVTVDTKVTLPSLHLQVKALPKGTAIVGDFKMTTKLQRHKAKAFEPVPMQVEIKGKGYIPLLTDIFPDDANITLFKEKPIVHKVQTGEGTQSTVIYPLAFSHDKSFTIPTIEIEAFNPKTQRSYTLRAPEQHIDVVKEDESLLLDKVDSPKTFSTDLSWLATLFSYLLVFTAGYLSALTLKWRKKAKSTGQSLLQEKISACKDERALLQLLMATESKKFTPVIERLEKGLYKNAKINLNKLKQQAIEEAS